MSDLTNVAIIKAILAQYDLRPQRKLGQHFLINRTVLQGLFAAAEICSTDTVIEVGAGIGTITVELAKKARKVYAVEIEKNLIPILKSHINDFKNVNVVQGDILKIFCHSEPDVKSGEESRSTTSGPTGSFVRRNVGLRMTLPFDYKVIGAVPYQITSPLLRHLLTQENRPSLIVIIIQKEVAGKIVACPPKATYLSNFVGIFGEAKIIGKPISPSSFWPQPDVYSAILKINFSPQLDSLIARSLEYSKFLHQGFSHPRKMLNKVFDERLLIAAGIASTRRAQTLTKQEWLKLFLV